MKRKRNHNDESNNNMDKKLRFDEEVNYNRSNNCDSELDNSLNETKEEFVLTREIADNAILHDIAGSEWRIGAPVGKGSFGEIYLASNDTQNIVNVHNANYVTKIEPHSSGPLFVEIHCLLNVNKEDGKYFGFYLCLFFKSFNYLNLFLEKLQAENENSKNGSDPIVTGIPKYIASGSHFFNDLRYRFLIMPRYKADLHSITKHGRLSRKHFLILASQIIDVLKHLHEKHYVHSDIKAQNIMIGQFSNHYNYNQSFHPHHKSLPKLNGFKNNIKTVASPVQYSGANPLRSCRIKDGLHDKAQHSVYNDMVQSHYLRPGRSIIYDENSKNSNALDSESSDNFDEDEDFKLGGSNKKKGRRSNNKLKRERKNSRSPVKNAPRPPPQKVNSNSDKSGSSSDHVYIIDYGLATKFVDTNGDHKAFCMDQRRAHDGTLEFTSRDAHFGAHSRRSDLECFGYNLIYWSQGYLPWKDEKLKEQPEIVHQLKEIFMTDVKEMLKLLYGKDVPKYLGEFMSYVGQLEFDDEPDYFYLKGLFEKEFVKLGFTQSDMKLSIPEVRDECEPIDRSLSEHDLMMASITDLKTVTKLGFLVSSDSVDGVETLVKPNESMSLNMSCKASPKNLRSKEKSPKGKRLKRQRKLTEKEIISEKIAKGEKLSIHEIATLDPEQIARDRAEKEYEKLDEKAYQTPQRYKGNPTYAILEIENRLKNKQNGSAALTTANVSMTVNTNDIEPIKGYTKPMMDVLKKQQMIVEQQLVNGNQFSPISTPQKRNRDGLRNVIKSTQKNLSYQNEVNGKKEMKKTARQIRGRKAGANAKSNKKAAELEVSPGFTNVAEEKEKQEENVIPKNVPMPVKRRGRPRKIVELNQKPQSDGYDEMSKESSSNDDVMTAVRKQRGNKRRKFGRPIAKKIVPPETEEDSVYYDIPGEGSNDGIDEMDNSNSDETSHQQNYNDVSSDDTEIKPIQKRLRRRDESATDENSNQGSISSSISMRKRPRKNRYYNDEDFEVHSDEGSNVSYITKSSLVSFKPRRIRGTSSLDSGINTRNKMKSRSTSRSAAATENSEKTDEEEDDEEGSEFEVNSNDESEEQGIEYDEHDQNISDEDDDDEAEMEESSEMDDDEDNDSIDIKYSPIKTRHARRRINCFNMKQIRGIGLVT